MSTSALQFIRENTTLEAPALLPEMQLYLAREITPIWTALEAWAKQGDLPPPFWAFAWPGGQAMARHILDNPEIVRGQRVLDFAAGSGLGAIAAAKAGAKTIWACDIDPVSQIATQLNATQNGVAVETHAGVDLSKPVKNVDLIMAGDVCYEQTMSHRVIRWLLLCVESGLRVLIADPGRAYAPERHPGLELTEIARYTVPTSRELEDRDVRDVTIWQLSA